MVLAGCSNAIDFRSIRCNAFVPIGGDSLEELDWCEYMDKILPAVILLVMSLKRT
jgi:hypothetical protein